MDYKTLGHYEIFEKIGEGGMGEVYRARDTKLGREVAVKILPEMFARNNERLGRFKREAKLLASLNHAGIATLHGLEDSDGVNFLVMELVDGEDLSQRISRGPLSVLETLGIARDVADALQTAHAQGIVHRDLKPANIKVLPDGKIKVLDFGLAKAMETDADDPNMSQSPTIATVAGTIGGVILGTAAYMSPEQARGKPVDKLTDVWALGCVFYQMLTGKQVFPGETVSDTIAKILEREPAWELLPADTPQPVQRLLHRCLQKDKSMRLQDVGEIRAEIDGVTSGASQVWTGPVPVSNIQEKQTRPPRVRLWQTVALVSILAAVLLGAAWLRTPAPDLQLIRSSIVQPPETRFLSMGDYAGPVVISPDGKRIAFVAKTVSLQRMLYVRDLDAAEARTVPGTEDAAFPFWAPDGQTVGYFTDSQMKRVDLSGGLPITVCSVINGRGGTWNQEGLIVFSPNFQASLFRVSASGGDPIAATQVDTTRHTTHRWPEFMPDGKHFLYVAAHHDISLSGHNGLYFGSLDGGDDKQILSTGATAVFANGYLLYLRENTLMAAMFDPEKGVFTGEPYAMADNVQYDPTTWRAAFSVSRTGILTYHGGDQGGIGTRLVIVDESGNEVSLVDEAKVYYHLALSPDGERLACSSRFAGPGSNNLSIWVYDLDRGLNSRLTFNNGADISPVWSPDGEKLVYATVHPGTQALQDRITLARTDGSGEEVLYESTLEMWPTDWSSDGKYIVLGAGSFLGGDGDIWILPMSGDRTPVPYLKTENREDGAVLSPDSRWMAYTSVESGQNQILVSPFSPPGTTNPGSYAKWLISPSARTLGSRLLWSRDGKQLFYINVAGEIWSVNVDGSGDSFHIGHAEVVATADPWNFGPIGYDVFPDGKRFVVNAFSNTAARPITLVQNWQLQLRR
jgi:serine/threonine protein kinase/Tol biopolymer transport system component